MNGPLAEGWIAQLRAAAAFVEVVRVADSIGVPVLPVKGVLTARQLYADPAERPMSDVDLRVRPRDLGRLCAAGEHVGWEPVERSRAYGSATLGVLEQRVELETHVGSPGFCHLSVDQMVARASVRHEPFGVDHLQPELHDHALLMVVNVFKDKLADATEWAWTDLARVPDVDGFSFERLAGRARGAGVSAVAWIVARWMVEVRGEKRWSALGDAMGTAAPRPLYAAAFAALVGRGESLPLRILARVASDSPAMQAKALAVTAATAIERALRAA